MTFVRFNSNDPRCEKTGFFAYAKTKTQISFAVTAKLISAFVFATQIVQSIYYLNPKFQGSSHLLWLYSPLCVGPGRKPRRPVFSQRGSNVTSRIPHPYQFDYDHCKENQKYFFWMSSLSVEEKFTFTCHIIF